MPSLTASQGVASAHQLAGRCVSMATRIIWESFVSGNAASVEAVGTQ